MLALSMSKLPQLPQSAVTYADIAVTRVESGVAAGVQLSKRSKTEDGRVWNEPYAVMSMLYDDLKTPSIRQALPVIFCDILREVREVDAQTKLVIFRSDAPQFQKQSYYEREIGPYAQQTGVDIKFNYKPRLSLVIWELQLLANDAIRRGRSLTALI